MKKIGLFLKFYGRWAIFGGTLFFLAKTGKDHWQEVAKIQINRAGWLNLAIALTITLLAHICGGWVWISILQTLKQPIKKRWGLQVYLKTNVAKYLPGNVWHFYGRILALTRAGGSLAIASLSVLLEPLLMATVALAIALSGRGLGWVTVTSSGYAWGLQALSLGVLLLGIHPRFLNWVIQRLNRFKNNTNETQTIRIEHYPILPLLYALSFLGLRGTGFLLTLLALTPLNLNQIPQLFSAFSFAWLLGLVVPGAPGGMGVFEATALALLNQSFATGILLSALALFRVVSILAEVSGAGLAILSEKLFSEK